MDPLNRSNQFYEVAKRELNRLAPRFPAAPPLGFDATDSSERRNPAQWRDSVERSPGFRAVESLHRYNVSYLRAVLFKHAMLAERKSVGVGTEIAETIRSDLDKYTQAMANYRAFRESPGDLRQNNPTWELAVSLVDIEEDVFRKSTSDDATTVDLEIAAAQQRVRAVDAFWSTLEVKGTNASGVNREVALRRAEEMVRDKNAFYARLSMALFGGLALIVPMLIMTLVPSRTTSLVTTSLCVLAVAVALSYFMKTAEAKDVMACTAGYAAVLVVFVGTGETTAAGGQSGTG